MARRSLFVSILVLVTAAFLLALSPALATGEEKPIKLRFAAVFPPPTVSLVSHSAELWMQAVKKKTGGRVEFQTFWGGALGSPPEHTNIAQKGMADVVLTNLMYTPGKFPLKQYEYAFPFGPVDPIVVTRAKRKIREEFPAFKENLAKYNMILISNCSAAAYQFMAKKPIQTLGDVKGQKVALIGRYFGRWVEPAGMVPVVAAAADRYTMLQTGVIDMDLLTMDMFFYYKVYEQAPNLILADLLTANFIDLLMNTNSFNKLPKDIQKIFLEAGKEVEEQMAAKEIKQWIENKVMKGFKEKGVKIFRFSEEDRAKWAQLCEDIPAEWAAEVTGMGYPGWEIAKRYQEVCEELGYKWPRKWAVKK